AVGRVLAPDGAVYLLVSSLAGVEEVVELAADAGFSAVALRDESFPFETLSVLKLVR
ncbi:methyltransferase, partial [Halorussus sp. GCM10023401]